MEETSVKQCCAAFYGSDFARYLLGDSFHPGGVELTGRVGELLHLSSDSRVLDVASGRGASALHLAQTFQCAVTGVDLSEQNLRTAANDVQSRGLGDRVTFQRGDAEKLPFPDHTFDAIICECALCTFPDKAAAAREFCRVLKPGGQLGLSDLTRASAYLPELQGLLSWIACIGDALPEERYAHILRDAGFNVTLVEDHRDALQQMVQQIQGRLLGAEVMVGLKKLDLPGVDFAEARRFALAAHDAIRDGLLGYAVLIAATA